MPSGKKITLDYKKNIVAFYKSRPMQYEVLRDKFDLSLPTIGKILKEFDVKPWNKFNIYSPNFNESYFEEINCEAKAYFVGLLLADGNVFNNYKSKTHPQNINLTLQEQDSYMLELLKGELCINKKVTRDGRGCCQLAIFSNKMANDLAKFSIVPNKSFIITFPQNVEKKLYRHLIRGYLDGDGSVSFYARPNRKVHTKAVRFCSGSKQFLQELVEFLGEEIKTQKLNLYQEKENLWSVAYRSKQDLELIIHYLYDEASIYLSRKKEKCDLILEEIRKYRDN